MSCKQKVPDFAASKPLLHQISKSKEITQRFGHFLAFDHQVRAVQPKIDESFVNLLQTCAFALRDLVFMVGKNEVLAPKMQVKGSAEQFHTHGTALDMPPRPAFSPRSFPEHF